MTPHASWFNLPYCGLHAAGIAFFSQETAAVMAGDGGDGGLLNSNISHQAGHRNWIMDLPNVAA